MKDLYLCWNTEWLYLQCGTTFIAVKDDNFSSNSGVWSMIKQVACWIDGCQFDQWVQTEQLTQLT